MWKIKMGDAHSPKAKVAAVIAATNQSGTANATNNPLKMKTRDRVAVKVNIMEVNQFLMCQLCSGYLIDATAIIECQHTFCKSCILKYLETNSYCPICDVQLNKAKPHMSLRVDTILQKIVYKTVPGLLVSEIRRRKDFARKFPSDTQAGTIVELDEAEDLCVLSPDDAVSLSLEYFKSDEDSDDKKQSQPQSQQQKQQALQSQNKNTCSDKANDRRYLQCPAAVSVGLLKKFIRMKYGLLDDYRVDLLYNGDRDSNLENDLTLLDLAFIFKWNKDEPMCFHYRIFDRPVKSVSPRPGTKRPAPPMMDEPPPDDDAASGPPNRSSMASAPLSKLPRISESGTNNSNTSSNTNTNNTSNSSTVRSCSSPTTSSAASASASSSPGKAESPTHKTSKGHSSHKSSHKGSKSKALPEEIPTCTMSRRSMSNTNLANNTNANNNTNLPVTRARLNSKSKSEKEEESKSKLGSSGTGNVTSTSNAAGTTQNNNSKHKQPSITTKVNNNGSVKLSITNASISAHPQRESLKISIANIAKEKLQEHSHEKKHHHHHHHRRHKLKKEKNREKKDKKDKSKYKDKDKEKNKHGSNKIKLSLNLNNMTASSSCSNSSSHSSNGSLNSGSNSNNNQNQSQNQSQQFCSVKDASVGGKGQQQSQQSSLHGVNDKDGKTGKQQSGNSNGGSGRLGNSSSHSQISVNVNGGQSNSNVNQSQSQGGKSKVLSTAGMINKNSGLDIQPVSNSSSSVSSLASSRPPPANNHHPLLPDSVQVPKSVTLIPVNPNAPNSTKSGNNSSRGADKSSNRLNSHTFTHPITNKSLHQITVTEVPPPTQKPAGTTNNSTCSSNGNNNSGSSPAHQSSGGSSSLEKAIVNAATGSNGNKPQFSGPGSMEITKINYSSSVSKVFDSATAKKLKERKGLDISISGTSLSVVKPANTREENYRQNISSGGMNQNSNSTAITNTNKAKNAAAALLSGKMPPGITIGPANAMATNTTRQNDPNKGGLTFSIPHHMGNTALPGNLPALRNIGSKLSEKSTKKDSNSSVGNGSNGKSVRTPPTPPPQQPSQQQQQQQQQPSRKHGETLSSMFDIRASPSPPKEKNTSAKDQMSTLPSGNNTKGFKRSFDANNSLSRKNHLAAPGTAQNQRESPGPERKRDRSNSNASSGSRASSSSSSADHDSPLDLSGKSSRSEHSSSSNSKSDISFPKGGNRPPTPVPKSVSPLLASSALGKVSKESSSSTSPHHHHNQIAKNNNATNNSSNKSTNQISNGSGQNSSIHSIAQTLHQKHNNQILQHQLGLAQQQQQNSKKTPSPSLNSSARTSPHIANSLGNQNSSGSSNNSNIPVNSMDSLSSPMIPMSNPSPPNTTGFNSLRMLADATLLHKMHPINSLMAAAGLCAQGVPSMSLSNPGGSVGNQMTPGLYGQSAGSGMNSGKPMGTPPGLLDPTNHHNLFAAFQSQSLANGIVSGMVGNPFGSSLSPPLYYPGNSVRPQTQLTPPTMPASLRIPTVTPKLSAGANNKGSSSPLNSSLMSPPHMFPSMASNMNSNLKTKLSSRSPPSGPAPTNTAITNALMNSNNPSSRSPNMSASSLNSNSTHGGNHRSQKMNGMLHSSVPILPPGFHNPLLPSRISSSSTSSSSSSPSTNSLLSGQSYLNSASSSLISHSNNKSLSSNLSSLNSSSLQQSTAGSKNGIPASMKISNFLPPPNKSNNSSSCSSNAQATITSSSSISSSLARFLNSLPPLPQSQQQPPISNTSLSLLPPFSVPSTKVESNSSVSSNVTTMSNNTIGNTSINSINKIMTSDLNAKSSGKSHSSVKIGLGSFNDSRKDTKGKGDAIGISSLSKSTDKVKIPCNTSVASNSSVVAAGAASAVSSGFGAPLKINLNHGLPAMGLGSPPCSNRTTQPQSQAVRHIPNPCLLFNRQNSGGNNNNVNINVNPASNSSPPTMTLNSYSPPINNDSHHDSTESKKYPLVKVPMQLPPTIPLQAQVAHSMLSLFPGVSVPLKVEVPVEEKQKDGAINELPVKSAAIPMSPTLSPPVKKAKLEIIDRKQSSPSATPVASMSVPIQLPIVIPVPPPISSVTMVTSAKSEEKVNEGIPVSSPKLPESRKQEINTTAGIAVVVAGNNAGNEIDNVNKKEEETAEISRVENNENKVEHDDTMKTKDEIRAETQVSLDDKKEDVERNVGIVTSEQISLENPDNATLDNAETDIVDVESVDVVGIEENLEVAKEALVINKDASPMISSIETKEVKDSVCIAESSPNKVKSEVVDEKQTANEETENKIATVIDSKEISSVAKLEPELQSKVDIEDNNDKADISTVIVACEEKESAVSESSMEIDVEGEDVEIELDVGVDEPMEVPLQGILQSLNSNQNSPCLMSASCNDNEKKLEEETAMGIDVDGEVTNKSCDMEITADNESREFPVVISDINEGLKEKSVESVTEVEMKSTEGIVNESVSPMEETEIPSVPSAIVIEEKSETEVNGTMIAEEVNNIVTEHSEKQSSPVETNPSMIDSSISMDIDDEMPLVIDEEADVVDTQENEISLTKVQDEMLLPTVPVESLPCEPITTGSTIPTTTVDEEIKESNIDMPGEKAEMPVELIDNEVAGVESAGATTRDDSSETELVGINSPIEREMEGHNGIAVDMNKAGEETATAVNLNVQVEGIEEDGKEKVVLNDCIIPCIVPAPCVSNEDKPSSELNALVNAKEDMEVAVNKSDSQNIIQMSTEPLTEETPTESPCSPSISSAPATSIPDPITITRVCEVVAEEVQMEVESQPAQEPVAPLQSTTEEVQNPLNQENVIASKREECVAPQIELQQTVVALETRTQDTNVSAETNLSENALEGENGEDQDKNSCNDINSDATRELSIATGNSESETKGSSSSLTSPSSVVGIVGVGVQRVNTKKMENLEKVAAGLLATANMNMGTISINNNNNNSLSPANCDITISAANHC